MMLVGIWFGLYWVLFSFFDHYIQSSVRSPEFAPNQRSHSFQFTCPMRRHMGTSSTTKGVSTPKNHFNTVP